MPTVETAADDLITAAGTAWPGDHTYKAGEVPSKPTTPYNVLSADAGSPGHYLLTAVRGTETFRVVVQSVGATHDECRFAIKRAREAFLDKALTIEGSRWGPGVQEIVGEPRRDPDAGGLMYALSTYQFGSLKEN